MTPSLKRLSEVSWVFFRIGCLGFGGPLATMAMMEEETHRKRSWITDEQFNEMLAITKILPGPVSTQLSIFIGKTHAGSVGGLLAGIAFILPAWVFVLILSYFYVHSGIIKDAHSLFSGMQIGALIVILFSVAQMSKAYQRQGRAWVLAIFSAALIFYRPSWEPLVILAAGLTGALYSGEFKRTAPKGQASRELRVSKAFAIGGVLAALLLILIAETVGTKTLSDLFWSCFKAGAFVFGTGLAVVPMLEGDAVRQFHWLTHSQFMDGLAIGQITPGPVVITATFIGFLAASGWGAIVATAGIFLPSFINVLFLVPLFWARWSGTPSSRGFSVWAIPAVIGGILGTTFRLGLLTMTTRWQALLFLLLFALAVWRRPPAWLMIPLAGLVSSLLF